MKANPNPNISIALTNASKLAPAAAAVDVLRAELTPPLAGAALTGAVKDVSLFVEPDAGYGPVLDFIGNATSTLDYWIYQLADPTLQAALAAAATRGVKVRVILSWQTFPAKSDLWDPNPSRCTISATGLCPVQCGGLCGNANYNPNAATADELRATGVAAQMSPFWCVGGVGGGGERENMRVCFGPCLQPPTRTHTRTPPTAHMYTLGIPTPTPKP